MKIQGFDYLKIGKQVILDEALALNTLPTYLDNDFNQVCRILAKCKGKVLFIGVGQSWHVAKKTSCSMSSLGTPSFYVHATEALHGDMGLISEEDVVVFISNSGETKEILQILEPIKRIKPTTIAVVSLEGSTLQGYCDFTLNTGVSEEAGPIKFAPSSSAVAMIALCDAIIMAIAVSTNFSEDDYLQYHPGGELGKKLSAKMTG